MRHDKPDAYKLRKEGKTYREIEKLLGVSRNTLCEWFRDKEWSIHTKKTNIKKNIKISSERITEMNKARNLILVKKYEQVEQDAVKEFEVYKNNPLFIGGLMLYAGEGDKISRFYIRLANSEFYLHIIFIRFCEQFLNVERDKIKFWLLLYPDHDAEKSIEAWAKKLQINKSNFYKSQVIIGKEKKRKLQYGVGNSIISSTSLKIKMIKWLELCKLYFK